MTYDDDRPGMMRVHIAQLRCDAIEFTYTRDALRRMCRARGLPTGGSKCRLAWHLALAGFVPPDYDRSTEK